LKKWWDRLSKRGNLIYWSVICTVLFQKDSSNSALRLLLLQNAFRNDMDDSPYQPDWSQYMLKSTNNIQGEQFITTVESRSGLQRKGRTALK